MEDPAFSGTLGPGAVPANIGGFTITASKGSRSSPISITKAEAG
jgi:hypothetical protein